ncbi:hypothetical protein DY000_02013599 [Brassica cretica]|uniref:Uncharacterized protein n=1 Tax=Brassica cretica TaxID=69181 RepID=A0ABQ7D1J4_BRACR|nr:hypothetical protein DY000_02013599 [Brassica cretica]
MTVDFNGKIDFVFTNLNTKFETLNTHVKKMEMQVVQTGDAVKRQEASTRRVRDDVMNHHVNAITEDDFWQVVKEEKLQEGNFEKLQSIDRRRLQGQPRLAMPNIDRHSEANIDRQLPAPIDPRAPITYRVQMPKIDVARFNTLRPKPKPSEYPPEPARTPSNDGEDPMEEDRVPTGES